MSEYTRYDFTESLRAVGFDPKRILAVLRAWGRSPEGYGSWEGGFVMVLQDGRYAYVSGWCDTTGWGCQDGADVSYAETLEGLGLEDKGGDDWDTYPPDLNLWICRGCPDPDDV